MKVKVKAAKLDNNCVKVIQSCPADKAEVDLR